MHTIVLTRLDASIPWGFRLQGGSEDELPFVLTHVSVFFSFVSTIVKKNKKKQKRIHLFNQSVCFCVLSNIIKNKQTNK